MNVRCYAACWVTATLERLLRIEVECTPATEEKMRPSIMTRIYDTHAVIEAKSTAPRSLKTPCGRFFTLVVNWMR